VIAKTEKELIKRLNMWKENVESKGMRVNHGLRVDIAPHFGGEIPRKPQFLGRE